ncbi:MAG: TIR domain-containing protein [Anaerolineales bacterium]|nr:MAG: TIR domain-containing protein [Anaerolineales bacterium]
MVTHLGVLQSQGLLDLWDDRRIGVGEDWYQQIQEAMAAASVTVLPVSANSF